jgi:hypothetical protein
MRRSAPSPSAPNVSAENRVSAQVTAIDYAGDSITVSARLSNDTVLRVRQALTEGAGLINGAGPDGAIPAPGETVTLSWRAAACIPLPD